MYFASLKNYIIMCVLLFPINIIISKETIICSS
jgi:hypothetical protein